MIGMNKVSMAQYNRIVVMKLLYRYGKLSIKELAQKMMLTISAVSKIVRKLYKENFISLSSEFVHCTGNHQGLWCINKDLNLFLCIHLSPVEITSLVVDSVGNAMESVKTDKLKTQDTPSFFSILLSHFKYWEALFPGLKYAALSLNGDLGHIQEKGDFALMLEEQTGMKIRIENACYTMSLAERWLNNEQSRCFIFVSVGYSLEAIFVLMDDPYASGHVIPIKLGQMCFAHSKEGESHYLETYIGENNLCAKGGAASIDAFYEALSRGKEKETLAYAEARRMLGMGLGNLINLFLPEKLIISGSFLQRGANLKEDIIPYTLPTLAAQCRVEKTGLDADQLMAGAAFLWIEEFLEKNNLL